MRDIIGIFYSFWITVIQDTFYGFIQNPKKLSKCKKIRSKLESHFRNELKSWISKEAYLVTFFTQMELKMIQPIKGLGLLKRYFESFCDLLV